MMAKTKREIAFLHGLCVEDEWTSIFTKSVDRGIKLNDSETVLYINAGTGNHALDLCGKLDPDVQMFAVCENSELQKIAQEKSNALNAKLDFSTSLPLVESDIVIADLSLISSDKLPDSLARAVSASGKDVAFFLPTVGSFGEVFSYLWEVLLDLDLLEKSADIESLITDLPTVSDIKSISKKLSLKKINDSTKTEILEFENGRQFVESPLIKYFLMPGWLKSFGEKEKEQVTEKLAQKIDAECDDLSFRCSVKATLITAIKS